MAKMKLYPAGITCYQPSNAQRVPPQKTELRGWTANSTRSLIRWLYSVDPSYVGGSGLAFTLTVAECPETPNDWKRLRESFFRRLHHAGISRVFWLTEWQRRGVPHLHGIVIVSEESPREIVQHWVKSARHYRAEPDAQDCKPIRNAQGWFEYLAKHSARGVKNYQRSGDRIPASWQGKTGRMWGRRGDWATRPPIELTLDDRVFFRLRRLIRSRAVSLARSRGDWKALSYARTMLKSSDLKVSRVRGLSRFCLAGEALSFLDALQGEGRISC